MSAVATGGKSRERTWRDFAFVFLFLGLFVWLRYYTDLWHYHWIGFSLGAVVGVKSLFFLSEPQENVTKRYSIPKRAYLISCIAFLWIGVSIMRQFFHGGTSDDGLMGTILLLASVGAAHTYYRLWQRDQTGSAKDQ